MHSAVLRADQCHGLDDLLMEKREDLPWKREPFLTREIRVTELHDGRDMRQDRSATVAPILTASARSQPSRSTGSRDGWIAP